MLNKKLNPTGPKNKKLVISLQIWKCLKINSGLKYNWKGVINSNCNQELRLCVGPSLLLRLPTQREGPVPSANPCRPQLAFPPCRLPFTNRSGSFWPTASQSGVRSSPPWRSFAEAGLSRFGGAGVTAFFQPLSVAWRKWREAGVGRNPSLPGSLR